MRHQRLLPLALCLTFAAILPLTLRSGETQYRRLSLSEYREKMQAGWIGQIAGVCWGAPTEFRWKDQIIPEKDMPSWKPSMINDAFGQDDLYVEMTFLRTLEQYGLNVSIRQAGIDFANSGYPLWCANDAGRKNLRAGIAPPDSGHPKFNKCPNDIDYQIEADYSGLIAPGLPQNAIDMGEVFGRLMNYGDGLYAGQFIGALYAEAFFENDPVRLTRKALAAIPAESQYAEMVRDMVSWYEQAPGDWQRTWNLCQEKYRKNPTYQKASNGGIDCKINGAYVLLGLLHGRRDLDQTILISCRGGMDSDCNPSSSGGVLFTTYGMSKLPARFTSELSQTKIFDHTAYSFPRLVKVSEMLARKVVKKYGGKVVKEEGQEIFLIPVHSPKPTPMELSWAPNPPANTKYTKSEMAKIKAPSDSAKLAAAVEKFAPGWKIANCGTEMSPGVREEWAGRKNVLATHPLDKQTGCVLSRTLKLPVGKPAKLHLVVGHDPQGDFDLVIRINQSEVLRKQVNPTTAKDHWLTEDIDLSAYAGKTVKLELVNQPSGWAYEAAYWAESKVLVAGE